MAKRSFDLTKLLILHVEAAKAVKFQWFEYVVNHTYKILKMRLPKTVLFLPTRWR